MIRIGLIGCGAVVHRNYARVAIGRSEYSVRYVCDTDPGRAAATARVFAAEATSPEALIEAVDAIVITTPPSTHASLIRECARPGMTILCEKPFATTHEEAVGALESSRAAGAELYVGQFRRAFPHLVLARQLVALGVIGEVLAFVASEGGHFSWQSVSGYTTADTAGGVLWDTGSHTLDMAMFAACLDGWTDPEVTVRQVARDKAEPSHDFEGAFEILSLDRRVSARLHVSRRDALPNLIRVIGTRGEIAFLAGLDDKVRLSTDGGSTVLSTETRYSRQLECFDVELRSILLKDGAEPFAAENFLGQVKVLETIANV